MNQTLTIGRILGIPVKLHVTLLIVPLLGAPILLELPLLSWLAMLIWFYFSALVHELAHALVARRFNIFSVDITLTPLGGKVRLIHLDFNPMHEMPVSLAGPFSTLFLAGICHWVGVWLADAPMVWRELVWWFFLVTALPGVINLLPGLPFDGGRALRGLLWSRLGRVRSTRITVWSGRCLALAGVLVGATQGLWVLFALLVAIWALVGGTRELRAAESRES